MNLSEHAGPAWLSLLLLFVCAMSVSNVEGVNDDADVGFGYRVQNVNVDSNSRSLFALLQVIKPSSVYGPDIPTLTFTASFERDYRLRVRITDEKQPRWEIPDSVIFRGKGPNQPDPNKLTTTNPQQPKTFLTNPNSDLVFTLHDTSPFAFTISRKSTNDTLFDTRPTGLKPGPVGLIFKDQFIQLSSSLPGNRANLYGLGEHTKNSFRLARNQTLTIWNEDVTSDTVDVNLYGSHPFYMDVRAPTGATHGVLLLNSNAMDVEYEGDRITYKVIGGIVDLYVFEGSKPHQVVDQYTELVGRPAPMPYWSFGFQQCRYGYRNISEVEGVVDGYAKSGIPLEVMWTDIDYMDQFRDFTLDPVNFSLPEMQRFVNKLHQNGQKYVLILDPGININSSYGSYNRALQSDLFIKFQGEPYQGSVWPGPVHFIDFFHPNTPNYWTDEIRRFRDMVPVDGLWTDMNECSDFSKDFTDRNVTPTLHTPLDDPPYKINNTGTHSLIGNKNIPTSAYHYGNVSEYNAHNLYGFMEAKATNIALTRLTRKRPFVLTRSTFVGSGKYSAHWTGDNAATWDSMAQSIPSILNSGLFGMPMVGADICGFIKNTTEELCERWIQLGAFYPFSRDHSDIHAIPHELYLWETIIESAKRVINLRYRLLPYYYTLMYEAHTKGTPIARPLFFSFPKDPNTYYIDSQFLIGKGVLVSAVLKKGVSFVNAYFPKGNWFSLFDYDQSVIASSGKRVRLHTPRDQTNVHVRGGSILAMQGLAMTTNEARKTPFELLVVVGNDMKSTGSVFLDNGDDIEMGGRNVDTWSFVSFEAGLMEGDKLGIESKVSNEKYALSEGLLVEKVTILGLGKGKIVEGFNVEGQDKANSGVSMRESGEFIVVEILQLKLLIGRNFKIVVQLKN